MALTPEEYIIQSKILNGNINDNTNLPFSAVPILNAKLKTTEKQSLIKAVNELVSTLSSTSSTAFAYINQLVPIIGDWTTTPELKTNMEAIGANILACIKILNDKLGMFYTRTELDAVVGNATAKFPLVESLPVIATPGEGFILTTSTPKQACFCVDVVESLPVYLKFDLTEVTP